MRYIYLILFSIFISTTGISQTETLKSKITTLKIQIKNSKGVKKLKLLDSLCDIIEHKVDFDYEAVSLETIDLAIKLDAINLAAKHASNLILLFSNRIERPKDGLKLFKGFSKNIPHITDSTILTELFLRGASSYFYAGHAQESLLWYDRAKKVAFAIQDSTQYGKAMTYKAFAMSEMGQFANASQEYQKSLTVFNSKKDTTHILTTKVGLSILYGKNAFYKESLQELAYVKEVSYASKNYPVYIMALNIIASNHYLSGDYHKAIKPLKEAIQLSEKYPRYNSNVTITYKTLANSYSKLGSIELAKKIIKKIENKHNENPDKTVEINFLIAKTNLLFTQKKYKLANNLGQNLLKLQVDMGNYEDILTTLEVLFKSNRALGNQNQELYYFKEHTRINDSINTIRKLNTFTYYQALYEKEKREIQIANQKTEIKLLDAKNNMQFQWMLLVMITLFSLGTYFYIINKRNKERAEFEKNKKDLAQQTTIATKLENELLNKEIEYKQKDLVNFAVEITQNQQWATILNEKFNTFKNATGDEKEKELKNLENEIRSKIIIDTEVKEFYEKIEKLGTSFYSKLNKIIPDLSKTEQKLCALIRLKIDNKQIASLQNISPTSVRTSRYRLRKKLNLKPEQDLDNFIRDL